MRYRIKARLAELGKKNIDVIRELKLRGITCSPSHFSDAINGRNTSETADRICEMANDIICEWEKEKHNAS